MIKEKLVKLPKFLFLIKSLIACPNKKGVIILTDIRGGTPSNAAANLLVREDDILALSGYNMPLLLELFTNRDLEMEDLKEGLYEAFRESLVDLRAETAGLCEEEIEL